MDNKQLLYDVAARDKIKAGVDKIANAVKVTMGAKGRNVIIDQGWGSPRVTKDGVTVAKAVQVKDRFENMGVELVKEASAKTNDLAGDGTTATCVLAQAIYGEATKLIGAGHDPIAIKQGIEHAVETVTQLVKASAVPVKDLALLEKVATISATDEEIGKKVAGVLFEIGADGVVAVEEGAAARTIETERVQGLQVDSGFISPYMMNKPERQQAELEEVAVLVVDKKISLVSELKPFMERIATLGKKTLVIVAENIESTALQFINVNIAQGRFHTIGIRAPGYGDSRTQILEDICTLTGAKLVSEHLNRRLELVDESVLGSAGRVIALRDRTVFVNGHGDKAEIDKRCAEIDAQVELEKDEYDKKRLRERKAKLMGGVGIFRIGGATETELQERLQRVEDAIWACKGALKEGIVPGGGVALMRAAIKLETPLAGPTATFADGYNVVREACLSPMKQIAENAGCPGDVVLAKCMEKDQGFNVATGEYGDLMAQGVIDPVLVVRLSLEHGASVANLLTTTECVIVNDPEKKPETV